MKSYLVLPALFASSLQAAIMTTPAQVGTYDFTSDGIYTDLGGFNFFGFDGAVSGIKKFDSSLGTLQEIRLTLNSQGEVAIGLEAYAEDTDIPGGEFFSASLDINFQTDIVYRPGGGSTGLSLVSDFFGASASIDGSIPDNTFFFEDAGFDIFEAFGDFEETEFGPNTVLDSYFTSDEDFIPSDFIGDPTEDVDTLLVGFFAFIDPDFDLSADIPGSNLFADATISLYPGEIEVEYIYDDSIGVIPEPASAGALFGLITLGGIALRRRR